MKMENPWNQRLNWLYIKYRTDGGGNQIRKTWQTFVSNNNYKPVIRKMIATPVVKVPSPSILIKRLGPLPGQGNNSCRSFHGKNTPYRLAMGYGMKGNTDGATLLAINTDKEKYNPGDEIKLSFPAPENARAIITLENSTGFLGNPR